MKNYIIFVPSSSVCDAVKGFFERKDGIWELKNFWQYIMKKTMLLASAALLFACSKQDAGPVPDLVTSTFEVSLGNVSTATKADPTPPLAKDWEMAVNNLTMFVYENSGPNANVCAYQKKFSAYELEKGKAVFAIPNVVAGKMYDFYAVANCDFAGANISRDVLTAYVDGAGADSYGTLDPAVTGSYNGAYGDVTTKALRDKFGTKDGNTGFIMTGMESKEAPEAGSNIPTRVTVAMKRTVAKVAVEAVVTAKFKERYPDAKLTVKEMKMTKLAEKTTLIRPASFAIANFGTATSVKQDVANGLMTEVTAVQGLFYIYENSDGAVLTGSKDDFKPYQPVLVVETEFDYDGDPGTTDDISNVTYNIKLAGEMVNADKDAADFGLFQRNGSYKIKLNINDLTENQVVAEVTIEDWEAVKVQEVNIGTTN